MIKIKNCFNKKMQKYLKRGDIKLSHYPNGSLCWAAKNNIGQVMVFNFGTNHGQPPKLAVKFSNSCNEW